MAGMSALKRLAPFAHVGGHLFRGRCARAAGARGVRRAGGGAHIEPRYRQFPQLTRSQVIQAEFFSATMWFWILWRFWHDSDAVLWSEWAQWQQKQKQVKQFFTLPTVASSSPEPDAQVLDTPGFVFTHLCRSVLSHLSVFL
uniref:NADH dehydrogenase [ubiquinone] 1 beta subcomplex subunit 2, mitochondrial n=2 Tax=Bos TaxID=9903 RepID=A0AAA9RV94_BOVIN